MTIDQLLDKMQRGAVDARETIGKFIEFTNKKVAHELPNALKNLGNELTRLKNQFFFFRAELGEAGVNGAMRNLTSGLSNLLFMLQPVAKFLAGTFERAVFLILGPIELAVAYIADFANWLGITEDSLKTNTASIAMWVASIVPAAGVFFLLFKSLKLFSMALGFVIRKVAPFLFGGGIFARVFATGPISTATKSLGGMFGMVAKGFLRFVPIIGWAWTLYEIFKLLGGLDWAKAMFDKMKPSLDKITNWFSSFYDKVAGFFDKLANKFPKIFKTSEEGVRIIEQQGANDPRNPYSNFIPKPSDAANTAVQSNGSSSKVTVTNQSGETGKGEITITLKPSGGAEKFVETAVDARLKGWTTNMNNDIVTD